MSRLICANDCSHGWLEAIGHLLECKGDCFNLVVEIGNPTTEHTGIRQLLDQFLETIGKKPIEEVANTIFPQSLYFPSMGRKCLYQNYETAWPLIRLFHANKSGTYFYRMIHWGDSDKLLNQLDNVIYKLEKTKSSSLKYRNIYEVSIYRPENDRKNRMGFPCLSHLSFKLDNGQLHLTAIYRNQFFIERAYGNLVGLGRLMDFAAKESGIKIGMLTCIATHAQIDYSRRAVSNLFNSCMKLV